MLDAGLLDAGWLDAGPLSLVAGVSGITIFLLLPDQEIVRGRRVSSEGDVAWGSRRGRHPKIYR